MAYIGNTVNNQGFTPAIDYFNGDGVTVTFTLSRPVVSVAQMIVAIDNVIQNPSSAFTVSGNSITFTSAPLAGTNNIWVEYTSLITTYNAISQDPSVIGDITATGGFLAVGDFGNTYTDGTIVDYVTGNARITTGPADGMTFYNGGTASRTAMGSFDASGNFGIGTTSPQAPLDVTYSNGSRADCLRLTNNNTGGYGPWLNFYCNYNGGYSLAKIGSENDSTGGSLRFHTADTSEASQERMRIDSSGRVTIPYQPSFHVRVSNASYISTSPVPFSNSVFDVGSNFNTSTYRFTAPIAGKYFFTLNMYLRAPNNADAYPLFRLNGAAVQYSYFFNSNTGGSVDVTTCMARIFNLSVGDYIDVTFTGGSGGQYYAGNLETNLFGYLIG